MLMTKSITPTAHVRILHINNYNKRTQYFSIYNLILIKMTQPPDDQARWITRGSTIIRFNGMELDMAKVPPCVCQAEHDWHSALKWWKEIEGQNFVTDDDLYDALLAWRFRRATCEHCLLPKFQGWNKSYNLAQARKRRAAIPRRKRRRRGPHGKFYFVDSDWEQD